MRISHKQGIVAVGQAVESIKERPTDAPAEAVIHPFLSLLDIFAAGQSHGSPQGVLSDITNGEPSESAKEKTEGN